MMQVIRHTCSVNCNVTNCSKAATFQLRSEVWIASVQELLLQNPWDWEYGEYDPYSGDVHQYDYEDIHNADGSWENRP